MYCSNENQEQKALFDWARVSGIKDIDLMFAIPNGGRRDARTGAILKKTGVKAGVPDIFLPIMSGEYGGLFIEMKRRKGGTVSKAQTRYIDELAKQGYKVSICKGWTEAREVIMDYLKDRR